MNIVIADDEKLVRFSLRNMLEQIDPTFNIVGEALNGEELLNIVRKYSPDIAFVDIKMPKINGLEAIRQAKKYSPDTQWIILTGLSDFDYAKESIGLGVSSYLLKPASIEELNAAMEPIIVKNRQTALNYSKEFQNEMIAFCYEMENIPIDEEKNAIRNLEFMFSLFYIDSCMDEKMIAIYQKNFIDKMKRLIEETITLNFKIALFVMSNGKFIAISSLEKQYATDSKYEAVHFFEKIHRIAKEQNVEGLSLTILQSEICNSLDELFKLINKHQNLSPMRIVAGIGGVITLKNLIRHMNNTSENTIQMCILIEKLAEFYKDKDYVSFIKCLEKIDKDINNINSTDPLLINNLLEFLKNSVKLTASPTDNPKSWLRSFKSQADMLLLENPQDKGKQLDIVNKISEFIENNYSSDISITQLSEFFNITPNYLCSLFHKKMGITFLKYLTKIRMLKAKELLSNTDMQIQEVSERVGYYSIKYFTKLYREFFGCIPSEIRKNTIK